MQDWYPPAKRELFADGGSYIDGVPWRGVLHTTEGKDYDGAKAVYSKSKVAPHFTVELELDANAPEGPGLHVYQHVPLSRAARALANPPGGVQTNRHRAIQVEVVASASNPNWPADLVLGVRALMIWIEAQTGIKPWSPLFVGSTGYGLAAASRMTVESWKRFDGWCGHQHVPENSHWDPGPIHGVAAALLTREDIIKMADEIHLNHPPRIILSTPTGQGYWIVAYDGGVFSFGDALSGPSWTAIGGGAVEKIISGTVFGQRDDPATWGAWLMGEDGGVFSLGVAQFKGRVFHP